MNMFRRELSRTLEERLREPRSFIQVVMGPRQTGKTTAIKQAVKAAGLPVRVASADSAIELGADWSSWNGAKQET